eukprot:3041398-Rhodomonas_salina.1
MNKFEQHCGKRGERGNSKDNRQSKEREGARSGSTHTCSGEHVSCSGEHVSLPTWSRGSVQGFGGAFFNSR